MHVNLLSRFTACRLSNRGVRYSPNFCRGPRLERRNKLDVPLALPNEPKSRSGSRPPPGADGAPEGKPATEGRSRWHSEVSHGAKDVAVAEGGEVERDCRFLEGDHPASGYVDATADAVAAAHAGQPAQGLVQR
jgi:hypothetical protein